MAITICMLNFKGGVGKTTATVNLGAALASLNKKVLIIDLDVQRSATSIYEKQSPHEGETIYDFLSGRTSSVFAYETQIENLDYVPSSPDMCSIEIELSRMMAREQILSKFVSQLSGSYDYILLDCPPGKGIVTTNAMFAADELIVPVECEVLPMYGLRDIMNEINEVEKNLHHSLHFLGIVANSIEHTCLNRDIVNSLNKDFPDIMFDTVIRKNVSLSEFPATHQSVIAYKKNSNGARDFMAFANEVIKKTSKN